MKVLLLAPSLYPYLMINLKRLFQLLSAILVLSSCTEKEALVFVPGELWYDSDSVHINAHGGGIMYHDGVYYWVGEHKVAGGAGNKAEIGVRIYSSNDLYQWHNEGIALAVVDEQGHDIEKGCIIERPKIVYNKSTKKFVMWFHLELKGQGYVAARTAVAISDSPTGPYHYIRSYRPNADVWPINYPKELQTIAFDEKMNSQSPEWRQKVKDGFFLHRDFELGQMSRDMTIFVDDDGKAYHIHSSENNQTLHISELTTDYTDFTGRYIRVFPGAANEAPAICKRDGVYYMISSGCTGWKPNPGRSARASSMLGIWESLGNPFVGEGANTSFRSQSTHLIDVDGKGEKFIYMGDRWTPKNAIDGRYVWLPLLFEDGKPVVKWQDAWSY